MSKSFESTRAPEPVDDMPGLDVGMEEIEAQVYEADQPLVHEGQKVVATTLSRPNEGFEGVVSFIYPHLDEATRTLTVRMELPSYGHRLRPGDYATVKVHVPPRAIAAFSGALAEEWAKGSAVDALAQAAVEKKTEQKISHTDLMSYLMYPDVFVKFAKARSYMVRIDNLVACRNIKCRKRFDLTGQTVFLI